MSKTNTSSKMIYPELTQEVVRKHLDYDPDTGIFTWIKCLSNQGSGKAGTSEKGYIRIRFDYRSIRASRLAFMWMTGEWPNGAVDHKNRVRDDNRWDNLRVVTPSQNALNSLRRKKRDLPRGVRRGEGRKTTFYIQINTPAGRIRVGGFSTPEAAHEEYLRLFALHHGMEFYPE